MGHRYCLAPYRGKGSRLVCPSCGQREFVPYIDTESGEIIHETCGRCNRESHCGYHLSPSQYFKENPGARPQGESWREAPGWLKKTQQDHKQSYDKPANDGPIFVLPKDVVEKTIRMDCPNHFISFLDKVLDPLIVEGLVYMYNIGSTKNGKTIFYQQDITGRIRAGKMILFNPEDGHRDKTVYPPVDWVTAIFQKHGFISKDWRMTQCLFGEHLLAQYPDQDVYLVEAEKTACIMAGLMPDSVFLATGGKTQLGERLNILRGRKVVAIPDFDAIEYWSDYFAKRSDLDVEVSDLVDQLATDEEREAQADIADIYLRLLKEDKEEIPAVSPVQSNPGIGNAPSKFENPAVAKAAEYFSPESMPEISALIEDLDLVPVSVKHIEPKENEAIV